MGRSQHGKASYFVLEMFLTQSKGYLSKNKISTTKRCALVLNCSLGMPVKSIIIKNKKMLKILIYFKKGRKKAF